MMQLGDGGTSLIRLFPASYISRGAIVLVSVLIRVRQICCGDGDDSG
jgi:hypothetical protein